MDHVEFSPHPSMIALPFEETKDILDHPRIIDKETFNLLNWWFNIKKINKNNMVLAAMVEAEITDSISEARRLVEQAAVKWNGKQVADPKMKLNFIKIKESDKEWGVFTVGKKKHTLCQMLH